MGSYSNSEKPKLKVTKKSFLSFFRRRKSKKSDVAGVKSAPNFATPDMWPKYKVEKNCKSTPDLIEEEDENQTEEIIQNLRLGSNKVGLN